MQLSHHASEDTLLLRLCLLLAGAGRRVGDGDLRCRLRRGQAQAGWERHCGLQQNKGNPQSWEQLPLTGNSSFSHGDSS